MQSRIIYLYQCISVLYINLVELKNCSFIRQSKTKNHLHFCGIPVVQNQYTVLEESEIVPGSEEDDEDGDCIGLINPRKTRAFRQKNCHLERHHAGGHKTVRI